MKRPRENRVPIMMTDDELKAIDDYRFSHRVVTRSGAIRELVRHGLRFAETLEAEAGAKRGAGRGRPEPEVPVITEEELWALVEATDPDAMKH